MWQVMRQRRSPKEGIKGEAKDALEDYMTEHLEWITSGSLSYNGKTYQIEDYYTDLPKDSSGKTDVSGGYLFELDAYYDEVSKFQTKKKQPIMFKNPSLPIRTPSCLQRRRIMYRLSRTVSIPRIIIRPTMVRRSTTPIWWIWIPWSVI